MDFAEYPTTYWKTLVASFLTNIYAKLRSAILRGTLK